MVEMPLNLTLNLALNHHWYLNSINKTGKHIKPKEIIAVAMSEGIPYLSTHVTSQWLEPSESGNFKIIANHLEISNITEELLPQNLE